jgi:hypothetical protein
MALPGLIAARNLADAVDRERAWDNLGLNISADFTTPESTAYIEAVETADAAFLEEEVKAAIHAFVVGCKIDGIWTAIKASCILAGARTLAGALVPLVGTAPTNVGPFDSGDYNRETGLVGNGTTKYLNTNRNNNLDGQNDAHLSCYASSLGNQAIAVFLSPGVPASGSSFMYNMSGQLWAGCRAADQQIGNQSTGFLGVARSTSTQFITRLAGSSSTKTVNSGALTNGNHFVFRTNSTPNYASSHRIAFYSIGSALDLTLLDARVTALMNAIAAAIP